MMSARISGFLSALAVLLAASAAQAQQVNHPTGFTGQTDLTLVPAATITAGGAVLLCPATGTQRGAVWTNTQLPINQFTTQFDFHILGTAGAMADGMGFCIQRSSATALGNAGGQMGYQSILTSVFIKFDPYNNVSTTQIYVNGADPVDAGSIDMRAAGVDFHSQHNFRCNMTYNGTVLAMTVKDLTSNMTFTQNFTIDIPTTIGGTTAYVGFTAATGGVTATHELLNWTYASLPAPVVVSPPTAGFNSITLNWAAVTGATGYIISRSTTNGGPYTVLATVGNVTTYVDNTVQYPTTYYYVVQATQGAITSLNSNQVSQTPLQPPITVNATALTTVEGGLPVQFNITLNAALAGGQSITFTVTSNVGTEGQVPSSGQPPPRAVAGISIPFPANGPQPAGRSIRGLVYGVDDPFADGPQLYTVTVTFTSTQTTPFSGFTIPVINCTNQDNDVPGIAVTPTAGLITSETGQAATFSITLATSPSSPLTLNFVSSNTAEGTVSPPSYQFTAANYNQAHVVTVTGVDDALLDFNIAYQITITKAGGGPAEYAAVTPPNVSVTNLDDEVPPALDHVWGGGCGMTGLEAGLALILAGLLRRRR